MVTTRDIAFVAGLLEGEGTFCLNNNSPRFAIAMADLDVVERARDIIDKTKIISPHIEKNSKDGFERKPRYTFTLVGDLAVQWMMTIYSFMGQRRKSKIRELIRFWKARGNRKQLLAHASLVRIIMMSGFSREEAEKRLLGSLASH